MLLWFVVVTVSAGLLLTGRALLQRLRHRRIVYEGLQVKSPDHDRIESPRMSVDAQTAAESFRTQIDTFTMR